MIDNQEWAVWMGVFADAIGRPLAAPTQVAYYRVLSAELTTDEFSVAAQRVLATLRFNVWPRPADFLQQVRPALPAQVDAGPVWDQVVAIVLGYRPPGYSLRQREAEVERTLGEVARRALQSAGGAARLLRLQEHEHDFMRREFVEAAGGLAAVAAHNAGVARLTGRSAPHLVLESGTPPAPAPIVPVAPVERDDDGQTMRELEEATAWLAEHPEHEAEIVRRVDLELPDRPGLALTRQIRVAQLAAELRAELEAAA